MTTTISGSNGIVFPDATSMQTGQQAVKAWVNFNGVGTVAIRAGYNVSSITDNGVGNYTVNFTTAMVDVNYAYSLAGGGAASGTNYELSPTALSTGSISVIMQLYNGADGDVANLSVAIFR